jgi:arsenate reductase (glutaredoxin)
MSVEMWDNPGCSKCAAARATLGELGVPVTLRPYLEQPPSPQELAQVLDRLGKQPWDICRLGESVAETLGMAQWARDEATRQRWIDTMCANPSLIQRPIVLLDNGSAIVARDPAALSRLSEPGAMR